MELLITGASGLLGSKIAEIALKKGYKVISGYLTHEPSYGFAVKLDVRNENSLRKILENYKPEVVVHTAALTDVDKCEIEKELAWSVNVEGTKNVARLCKKAFLIYVSTDYVFEGEKGMYREEDEANPINYYGITKLEGEKIVKELGDFCIARTSVIYGARKASGKVNFALWVMEKLRRGEEIKVLKDHWNSPTLNTNLAEMILEIAERRLEGVYHLAGATRISRYEFANLIAETFDLKKDLIKPIKMEEMRWIARRPRDSSLNVEKAMKLRNKPNEIGEALKRLKEEISQQSLT
ncbi:MAG: dTDP-4-dehydrorhamnose reductase [Archaeoglobaceae archaeon]